MAKIFNRHKELEKRRILRANQTNAEKLIWEKLRKRNISGYRFRRQYSIGPYIADFFCPEAKLAIEIDGSVHETTDAQEYDEYRNNYIESIGINILRFKNDEIENNIDVVVEKIEKQLERLS